MSTQKEKIDHGIQLSIVQMSQWRTDRPYIQWTQDIRYIYIKKMHLGQPTNSKNVELLWSHQFRPKCWRSELVLSNLSTFQIGCQYRGRQDKSIWSVGVGRSCTWARRRVDHLHLVRSDKHVIPLYHVQPVVCQRQLKFQECLHLCFTTITGHLRVNTDVHHFRLNYYPCPYSPW